MVTILIGNVWFDLVTAIVAGAQCNIEGTNQIKTNHGLFRYNL